MFRLVAKSQYESRGPGAHSSEKNIYSDQLIWFHFIGKSRTFQMARKLAAILQEHFSESNSSWSSCRQLIDGFFNRTTADCTASFNDHFLVFNRSYTDFYDLGRKELFYSKSLKVLITVKAHDLGYNETTRRFNASDHLDDVYSLCMDSGITISRKRVPDTFIVNKGIHTAAFMQEKGELLKYQTEVRAYFDGIFEWIHQLGTDRKVDILWRRSSNTHFVNTQTLNLGWSCRSPFRMNCVNRLSDDVLTDYVGRTGNVRVKAVDHWTLSLGRADCAHDNRHYRYGNCMTTLVFEMLYTLAGDGIHSRAD